MAAKAWAVVLLVCAAAGLVDTTGAMAAPTARPAPCAAVSGPEGDLSPSRLAPGRVDRLTNHAAANVASVAGVLGPSTLVGLVPAGSYRATQTTYYSPVIVNVAADTVKALPGGVVYQGGPGILAVTDGVAVYPQSPSSTITTAYGAGGQAVWNGLYGGRAAGDVLISEPRDMEQGDVVTEARTGQVLGALTVPPSYIPSYLDAQACSGSTLYIAAYGQVNASGSVGVTVSAWSLPDGEPLWTSTVDLPYRRGYVFNPSQPPPAPALFATPEGALLAGAAPYAGAIMLAAQTGDTLWRLSAPNLAVEPGPGGQVAAQVGAGPIRVLTGASGRAVRTLAAVHGATLVGASAQDLVLAGGGRLTVEGWRGQDRRAVAGPGGAVEVFEANDGVYAVGLQKSAKGTTLAMQTLAPPRSVPPYRLAVTPWRLLRRLALPGRDLVGAFTANGQILYLASAQTDRLYVVQIGSRAVGSLALPDAPLSLATSGSGVAVALSGCPAGAPGPCTASGHVLLWPIGPGVRLARIPTTLLSTTDAHPLVADLPNSDNFVIADGAAGQLRVVNAYDGKPVATVSLPAGHWSALAVTPTGSQALISDATSNQVLVVNLVTFAALPPLPCRTGAPGAITITPDGSYAYVDQVSSQRYVSPTVEQIGLRRDSVSSYNQVSAPPGPLAASGPFDSLLVGLTDQNVVDLLPTQQAFQGFPAITNWLRLGPDWSGGVTSLATAFGGAQALVAARGVVASVDMRTGNLDQTLLTGLPAAQGSPQVASAADVPMAAAWDGPNVWIWVQAPPR